MSSTPVRVGRVTGRASFDALRRSAHRARSGPLSVSWLPPGPDDRALARVAYAVGRSTGGAVVRNRIRRRLRAAASELARTGDLPAGTYSVGAGSDAADLAWDELRDHLRGVIQRATSPGEPR